MRASDDGKEYKMKRTACFVLVAFLLAAFAACSAKRDRVEFERAQAVLPARQDVRMKVIDVSNDTGELFDVDVIGMLWSGLDESLKRRGLLWTEDSPVAPLRLEAHILKYNKGNFFVRNLAPYWGKTQLTVRCEIKQEEREVASVESKETISMGHGGLMTGASRKIFSRVSEDIVNQLAGRL
jgi:hypothetical protein